MSRQPGRARILSDKNAASKITIRLFVDSKDYTPFMAQGWKENDKWQRRQFKDEEESQDLLRALPLARRCASRTMF